MKNITLLILLFTISYYTNAQDCNCNLISNNLTLGTGTGEGKLITSFSDNKIFDFFYPRYRGGWKWTTNSSQGITQIMELRSYYDKGTNIDLTLGSGSITKKARFITNIADNSVFEFFIPRWRGGWKWTTSTSNGTITAMQLHNKLNGGDVELRLDGIVISSEVKVQATVWPDFVFEKHYDLPTLDEVEKYIKDKGHLKDIPSQKEIERNGLLLGEMNAKLLQKIEELTMYTIDQEKKIEIQNSKTTKLEKEMEALNFLIQNLLETR
ncbi:hypothetical protein ACE939_11060 [Aquimarina sp. W85]|uniref:hypothetical protein n=1 Tax=Aquimarina rhodophyticola TaxID=3342246 RepID=UPI0036713255